MLGVKFVMKIKLVPTILIRTLYVNQILFKFVYAMRSCVRSGGSVCDNQLRTGALFYSEKSLKNNSLPISLSVNISTLEAVVDSSPMLIAK